MVFIYLGVGNVAVLTRHNVIRHPQTRECFGILHQHLHTPLLRFPVIWDAVVAVVRADVISGTHNVMGVHWFYVHYIFWNWHIAKDTLIMLSISFTVSYPLNSTKFDYFYLSRSMYTMMFRCIFPDKTYHHVI